MYSTSLIICLTLALETTTQSYTIWKYIPGHVSRGRGTRGRPPLPGKHCPFTSTIPSMLCTKSTPAVHSPYTHWLWTVCVWAVDHTHTHCCTHTLILYSPSSGSLGSSFDPSLSTSLSPSVSPLSLLSDCLDSSEWVLSSSAPVVWGAPCSSLDTELLDWAPSPPLVWCGSDPSASTSGFWMLVGLCSWLPRCWCVDAWWCSKHEMFPWVGIHKYCTHSTHHLLAVQLHR